MSRQRRLARRAFENNPDVRTSQFVEEERVAADRNLVFEPFKTNKTGGAGKPRGTGLGLAIAKRFVEDMGGRIGLDPSRDCTCFFIELVAGKTHL